MEFNHRLVISIKLNYISHWNDNKHKIKHWNKANAVSQHLIYIELITSILHVISLIIIIFDNWYNNATALIGGKSHEEWVGGEGSEQIVNSKFENHLNLFLFDVVLGDEEPEDVDDTLDESTELNAKA